MPRKRTKITLLGLKRIGACDAGQEAFLAVFPGGVAHLNRETLDGLTDDQLARLGKYAGWAADAFLSGKAWAKFWETQHAAYDARRRALWQAEVAWRRSKLSDHRAANETYDQAADTARREYYIARAKALREVLLS